MFGFIIRLLINAVALWIAAAIIPGIDISGTDTLILGALLLGFVNAIVRPIVIILTFPFTIITLGFFLLVINAAMLGLVAWLLDDFSIAGFWSAFFGSLIISIFGWWTSWSIGPSGRIDYIYFERKG